MIHSDYVMRMVSMLATFLARVLLLKQRGTFPLALTEIDQAGRTLIGMDRGMMRLFGAEQLMALFGKDLSVALPKAYVLGVLMVEEAGILDLQGETAEAAAVRMKALHLLLATYVAGEGPVDEKHDQRIDRCVEDLGDAPRTPAVQELLERRDVMPGHGRQEPAGT